MQSRFFSCGSRCSFWETHSVSVMQYYTRRPLCHHDNRCSVFLSLCLFLSLSLQTYISYRLDWFGKETYSTTCCWGPPRVRPFPTNMLSSQNSELLTSSSRHFAELRSSQPSLQSRRSGRGLSSAKGQAGPLKGPLVFRRRRFLGVGPRVPQRCLLLEL